MEKWLLIALGYVAGVVWLAVIWHYVQKMILEWIGPPFIDLMDWLFAFIDSVRRNQKPPA
jgi:hypothetical protein